MYQYSFSCKGVSECLAYPDFRPNYNKQEAHTHTSIVAAIPKGVSVFWVTMGKLTDFLVGKRSSKVVKCVKAEKYVTVLLLKKVALAITLIMHDRASKLYV